MDRKSIVFYMLVLLCAGALLLAGNRLAAFRMGTVEFRDSPLIVTAVVTDIVERVEESFEIRAGLWFTNIDITFRARITSRGVEHDAFPRLRGREVTVTQGIIAHIEDTVIEVTQGDRILLMYNEVRGVFIFSDFIRIHNIILLGVVFFALIMLFGRGKGFMSIIALGFTCAAIFIVFIPAILAGLNIYIATFLLCAYAVLFTLLLVVGANKKALVAMLGCLGGVVFAGVLMLIMDRVLSLTGFIDQDALSLFTLPTPSPIDLRAIIFAGVIIGAVGAIMDVAMSIASSLWEIRLANDSCDFKSLFNSGINIGRDIMGTMLNTLILAYIGSSLSMILLSTADTRSLLQLLNTELIAVELLRALVGSFGMLLTIPLTACACAYLYNRKPLMGRNLMGGQ